VRACATGAKPKDFPAARTAFRATHARDNPRSKQREACLATTLIGRWQLVRRRLGWTRGAQQVGFMCYARARSNLATMR